MSEQSPSGDLVIQTLAMPSDTNANGDVFGGWLVSQMDLGAGIAARQVANSRVVTVKIDTMTFIKPVYVGDIVSCYAQLQRVGRTSMTFQLEVWVTRTSKQCAHVHEQVTSGCFTFVAVHSNDKPYPVYRDDNPQSK